MLKWIIFWCFIALLYGFAAKTVIVAFEDINKQITINRTIK